MLVLRRNAQMSLAVADCAYLLSHGKVETETSVARSAGPEPVR